MLEGSSREAADANAAAARLRWIDPWVIVDNFHCHITVSDGGLEENARRPADLHGYRLKADHDAGRSDSAILGASVVASGSSGTEQCRRESPAGPAVALLRREPRRPRCLCAWVPGGAADSLGGRTGGPGLRGPDG